MPLKKCYDFKLGLMSPLKSGWKKVQVCLTGLSYKLSTTRPYFKIFKDLWGLGKGEEQYIIYELIYEQSRCGHTSTRHPPVGLSREKNEFRLMGLNVERHRSMGDKCRCANPISCFMVI